MLAVSRARSFAQFRAAFESFAVPGQNMLYADADGNIGRVLAVRPPQPQRTACRYRHRHGPARCLLGCHAQRCGAALQLQSGVGLPGFRQRPAAGDRDACGLLLLARRPGGAHARPHRGRNRGKCRDPQGLAAGRLHGVVGNAARSLRRQARCAGNDRRGRCRRHEGDRAAARLGRRIPRRLDRGGHLRAVPPRLHRPLLRPALRRRRWRSVRLGRPAHGAAARGHRRRRRGDAARGARRRAGGGLRWPRVVRQLGRDAPPQPRASALQRPRSSAGATSSPKPASAAARTR